ncbi:hypothetical protein GOBAR_DD34076 [Gossypium barbadense]|nr:hypothetical protein GOBAR_DD34076 [Gossypium barbadense]
MSLDTVSFEELLGHCYQIFNNNQTHLLHLKNHLKPLEVEIENDEEEEEVLDSNDRCFSVTNSAIKSLDEDPLLLDESMSLKNFGLSDVCLATLASQASVYIKMKKPNAAIRDANATLESELEFGVIETVFCSYLVY